MHRLRRALLLACLTSLLAGCSLRLTQPDVPARAPRESVERFTLDGRLAITHNNNSNTLRIRWEHTPQTDTIAFSGPLGNQLAELHRDSQGARWTSADGSQLTASSADALMARLTEIAVPLDSLSLWVLGRTGEQGQILARDEAGRLQVAQDGNWQLRVTAYENEHPHALPTRMEVEGSGLRIRFVIEEWQP